MRKLIVLFLFIALIGVYLTCYTLFLNVSTVSVFNNNEAGDEISKKGAYTHNETALLKFIESRMMGQDGQIYTNAKPDARSEGTLSESVGLLMNYCILRDKKDLFDREINYMNKKLMTEDYYIKWRDSEEKATCNATIDDLRIVRALMDAYDKWGDKKYLNTAGFIQDKIFEKQVENEYIYEFYDWNTKKSKKTIPLCYLDLYTMDRMSIFNKGWLKASDSGYNIITNGKIALETPLYYKYYDYKTKKYITDEEYKKGSGICLTYTLYTVLHLAEMNGDTVAFTEWLLKEMDKGKLYAWYDPESLKHANEMESTAVYALAAVYAKKAGENELYHKLVERMMIFMVKDINSPNYGGFGNEQTGDFYSFDNLTALWAYAVE